MMPIDWGKRALGDFRSWHLADMRVSANVRFAPKAVVAQAGLAQRLLQKGRPASPSEPTAIGELLPSFAGIEKRNCEDFADGACRPFDAGPSESFAGSHLVGLSTKSQKRC
jgi:hypothetical protein